MVIIPANGSSSFRIRKIGPDTDRAQMTGDAKVVAFCRCNQRKASGARLHASKGLLIRKGEIFNLFGGFQFPLSVRESGPIEAIEESYDVLD